MGQDAFFKWQGGGFFARGQELTRPEAQTTGGFSAIFAQPSDQALGALGQALMAGRSFCFSDRALPQGITARRHEFLTLTGGSTGAPKIIRRTQASWIASFEVNAQLFGFGPGRAVAVLGRLSHSLALYGVLEGLHLGMDVHVLEGMKPGRQRAEIAERSIDVLYTSPTQLRLLAQGGEGESLPEMELILIGGGTLDAATRDIIRRLCPNADLRVFYGAAETSFVSLADPDTPGGSVGRAFPGVEIRLRDGVVWVRSPYLFLGYVGGEAPDTRWEDGFLSVGELGELDTEGHLFLQGRKGRVISVADQTVFPEAIEALVADMTGGRLCAALPTNDPKRGQRVALIIEGAPDAAVAERVSKACRAQLGLAAVPRRVLFKPELPLLPSGKVDLVSLARWREDQA